MRRLTTALAAAFFLAALPSVSSAERRVAHTATLLPNGDVLIAGGVNETGGAIATAELFTASIGNNVIATGGMTVARASHTATLMTNGCVLIAGGNTAADNAGLPTPTNDLRIYDPTARTFSQPTGALTLVTPRFNHTATLLNSGDVLICGGQNGATDGAGNALSSCEIYRPSSCGAGTLVGGVPSLLQARYNHTATLLKDGRVWFAGGRNPAIGATGGYLSTSERYDEISGAFSSASPLIEARAHHTTTLMGDGKALVVGGYNKRDVLANTGITESAEIYDPTSNSVSPAAAMETRRQSHATVLSADGKVKVFGGLGNITTTFITPPLNTAGDILKGASNLVFDLTNGVVLPTATVNAASIGLLDLDFLLNKPVFGVVQNGEMWLSSPTIMATWGAVRFLPASNTNPAVGARIDLAGQTAGCRLPDATIVGNCGNIQTPLGVPAIISRLQGQAVFYKRTALALSGTLTVTAGKLNISSIINTASPNANLSPGSQFSSDVSVSMDNAFIGKTINAGNFALTAGSLVQVGSFTVTLTGGVATLPGTTVVGVDGSGNGEAIFTNLLFTSLTGTIAFTGVAPMFFDNAIAGPPAPLTGGDNLQSLPIPGAALPVTATVNMTYTTNGANVALTPDTFQIDVATVIIRKMIFADGETYNPKANSWTLAPPDERDIANNRYGHSATLLPNNDRVFIGGRSCAGATCTTQTATPIIGFQELSLEKNFVAAAGAAAGQRAFHTATLLPDGDILLAGGTNGPSILSSAELFTPGTEAFSAINGSMRYVRDLHTATLMPNGRVLIAGGFTTNAASTGSTNTVEIYYPDTKQFIETAPMISSRSNHSAILLPDGQVFVAGGFGNLDVITGRAEIFITTKNVWMAATAMDAVTPGCQRALHATVQLKNGHILLIGGINASGPLTTTADYNPLTNTWDCTNIPALPTALRSHSATLLFDGRILVTGGNDGFGEANKSFIYAPGAASWVPTHALPLLQPRFNHTATLLPNGTVMISGGSQRFGNVPTAIEVFHINGSSWVTGGAGATGMQFSAGARAFHTMTLALNNKMYGIGGSDGVVGGNGVSLYTSAEAGYFTSTPDSSSKDAPPSFRQSTISSATTSTLIQTFLPGESLVVTGNRFRGGTEASGGGAASANSAFSYPHVVLQQVDGSGGAASQSNGGFVVDLTTQVFLNAANLATLDTKLTVALPSVANKTALPYGWYTLRTGANDIYSDGKLIQVGPLKPTAPVRNLSGVAASTTTMTWTWLAPLTGPTVDGYSVYNATTGVFITTIAAATPRFDQNQLDPGATTSIMIAGYTLLGDGPLSASPTFYTLSTAPVNVTIASVTFSDLLLFWGTNRNASPGTTYEVTQSSSEAFGSDVSTPVPRLFNLTTNFTIISNLSANTTYFFRVQAFNLAGLGSPYSAAISTRTRSPVTQPIVSARTTSSIDWGWADPGGITNYRVYNATNAVLLDTVNRNSFSEVNLGTNTEHSIRVSAVTNAGEGPLSPSASAYTSAATPGPFNPRISGLTTGSFLINWTNNGNPLQTGYSVTVREFASDGSVVSESTNTAPPFTFSMGPGELLPSTLYGFEVVAFNGDSLLSDIPAVIVGSTWTLPTAPTALTVLNTSPTTISVSWNTNNNSSSATYQVTFSSNNFTINIATAIFFTSRFGGSSATLTGLITSATYSVRVIASNPFGQLSQFSNVVTTQTFNGGAVIGSLAGVLAESAASEISGTLGNGRALVLRAAAHTFPSNVNVTLSSFTPAGPLCPGATVIAFSIVADPALQPIGSLYFSFDFSTTLDPLTSELGTIPTSRALLMRYEPGSPCVPLETTVAVDSFGHGWMTARINHLSIFQVGQVPVATTAETARLFPNPFYTSRDGYATIDNVPPSARVRIFTLRGEQVLDVKANASGLLTWSGTNGSGRAVASGVYLVMVESGGSKKVLKLAVVR